MFLSDLDANRVAGYLAERRNTGLSVESSNHYLRRVKQFARWLVRTKRVPDNPLDCLTLLNTRTDRRHDRRALTDIELRRLLDTTRKGPTRFRMTGSDRARLYQLAVETGLRASELRSLTWGSFELDGIPPTVTVKAAYSKHRRDDTLPLKASTAAMLNRQRDESDGVTFDTPVFGAMPEKLSKMIRADLADAGINYRDDAGRYADFHSLRHTFISNLARGGVHPKVAQQLARHSTITLTMDRYSHTVMGDLSDGLAALPELSPMETHREHRRATGTCDIGEKRLPLSLPTRAASQTSPVASHRTEQESDTGSSHRENPRKQWVSCIPSHPVASGCTDDKALRVLGLEPRAYGLKGRCSTN